MKNTITFISLTCLLCELHYSGLAQSSHKEYWATDNNVIELRNDGTGNEFFRIIVMPFPVSPEYKYFQPARTSGKWETTTGTYQGGSYPEAPLWPIEVTFKKGDGYTAGRDYVLLENRNIPPPNSSTLLAGEINRGNHVSTLSREFGDYEKDLEFIVNKRDEILREAGLSASSSQWDKVMTFAEYCYQKRKNTEWQKGLYLHPVDFCIHGDFCVGAANALAAFASTINVPSRLIQFSHHTTAEIFLDGQWRWVDNTLPMLDSLRKIPGDIEKGPLFSYSFLEMIADPMKYQLPGNVFYMDVSCLLDDRKGKLSFLHEIDANWVFHLYGMYKNAPYYNYSFTLGSARELRMLYPEKESLTYKSDSIPRMWLTPFRNSVFGENREEWLVMDQSKAIRQTFYISDLEDVKYVRAYIPAPQKFWRAMPEDGGDWYFVVNGRRFYVKDIDGGWNHAYHEEIGRNCVMFDIPLEALNEDK